MGSVCAKKKETRINPILNESASPEIHDQQSSFIL